MAGSKQVQQQRKQGEDAVICVPPDEARKLLLRGVAPAGMHVDGDVELASSLALTSLPDGLSVAGKLNLRGCSALAGLGSGLSVGGDLDLEGCSALQARHRGDMDAFFEQLSAVLGPEAGLSLQGWDAVEHIPDGFAVGGDLGLGFCSSLTSLGDGLSVGGQLNLRGCWALGERHRGDMGAFFEQLSAVLGPKAGLSLRGWDAVEHVPDGFRVGGDLTISGWGLTSLGEGISVGGQLNLHGCYALTSLGDGLSVAGKLNLRLCSALTELASGLSVGGDLDLCMCLALTSLPGGLSVGGQLNLCDCSALTELGSGLSVGGDLSLEGCSALQERHRGDMGAFFEQLSAVLGPKAGLSLAGWDAVEHVPDGFRVGGNLFLWNCSSLTSLGDSLSVGGDLILRGSSALANLGDSLSVGGHLSLWGCSALQDRHRGDMGAFFEHLSAVLGPKAGLSLEEWDAVERVPDGFSVGGDLNLRRCSALTRLGDGLNVGGDLHLIRCTALTSLPDDLGVGGDLYLEECSALTSLGDGLSVAGELSLSGCSALTELASGLSVGGCLYLSGCSTLKRRHRGDMDAFFEQLSTVLGPKAGLFLAGWEAVEQVPNGFRVGGELCLASCSALFSLGDGVSVGGDLNLEGCLALQERYRGDMGTFFEQLSAVLGPKAGLSLAGWDAVEQVPDGFSVGGDLNLDGCSALTSLGDGIGIGGNLWLNYCSALTGLGDGLTIGGRFWLRGCTALTSLGDGLRVGDDLNLADCSALTSLGDGLVVGDNLNLAYCSALESFPASILEWPLPQEDGMPHDIDLSGSGLSQETLDWLCEVDAPGIRFQVNFAASGSEDQRFSSAEEAAAFWAEQAGVRAADVHVPSGDDARAALITKFLARLESAKEFGITETRKALATRVVDVLVLLNEDALVREELLLRMADSLDACGDKPVWALNQMHLVVEVAKARGDRRKLRALGRRVMRLMVVHEHAKRKVDSLSWVDDVCVYLRFEIDLREALDLPVAATAMIFPSYINVTDKDLEAAKEDALAITDARFEAWLAGWPEWQRHQRHQVVAELRWQELAEIKRRQSLRKRVSRRLSRLVSVVGDKVVDHVTLDGGKSVWSLSDLLKHWERTGLDLHNAPVPVQQLRSNLKRVVA